MNRNTPLHCAVLAGNVDAAHILLEAGASVDLENINVRHAKPQQHTQKLSNCRVQSAGKVKAMKLQLLKKWFMCDKRWQILPSFLWPSSIIREYIVHLLPRQSDSTHVTLDVLLSILIHSGMVQILYPITDYYSKQTLACIDVVLTDLRSASITECYSASHKNRVSYQLLDIGAVCFKVARALPLLLSSYFQLNN